MNKKAFVNAIQIVVEDGAITTTVQALTNPPSRKPDERLWALSSRFKRLPPADRQNIELIMEMTGHAAVFGFLCVLDGVRAFEGGPGKGALELLYRDSETSVMLIAGKEICSAT